MVEPKVKLSILDRSRTRAGASDAAGLTGSVERAQWAEDFGYHRFWVAELHAVPGIASGAPAVLLAAIGAHTNRIRLGSGGVMLPNHQPLVVAEQFLMLDALYPGRVDLGVGRSLGFTPPVRQALRRAEDAPDTFAEEVDELRGFLAGSSAVTARPATDAPPPVFVLATRHGLPVAAEAGLPVVVGGPVLQDPSALDTYRREFRGTEPYVVVSLEVMIAESADEARRLLLPEAWAIAESRRTGDFPPLEDPNAIPRDRSPKVRERIEKSVASAISGTVAEVSSALDQLVERTGADEILVSTSTFERDALRESDRALSQL